MTKNRTEWTWIGGWDLPMGSAPIEWRGCIALVFFFFLSFLGPLSMQIVREIQLSGQISSESAYKQSGVVSEVQFLKPDYSLYTKPHGLRTKQRVGLHHDTV